MIRQAETDADIERTFAVMKQLRPTLRAEDYTARIRELMDSQGYRLAFLETDGVVCAVAGYRFLDMLYCGKFLSIDDLVTDEHNRSKRLGATLLDWLYAEARRAGCTQVELISNTMRESAHRFYFRSGFTIDAFHFRRKMIDT